MPKQNRQSTRDRQSERKDKASYSSKVAFQPTNDWKLDWFTPTKKQMDIVDAMHEYDLTLVQAPSGCGKSSVAIWKALNDLKQGHYRKILFLKNPTEVGDDMIGYLKGEATDKLKVHFAEMKRIFLQFISRGKLEADESKGTIEFSIPNFQLGSTHENTLIIIDEAQTMSPSTLKLLIERTGEGSRVVVLGDYKQRYSIKKREDGFTDLIEKVTEVIDGERVSIEDLIEYVELSTDENQRSALSKRITELYA